MMRILLIGIALMLPVSLWAQDELPIAWRVEFWSPGVNLETAQPVSTFQFARADVTCGLALLPSPQTVTNPTKLRWTDPFTLDPLDCEYVGTTGRTLLALPVGANYFGTLIAIGSTAESPRSASSNPFSVAGVLPEPPPPQDPPPNMPRLCGGNPTTPPNVWLQNGMALAAPPLVWRGYRTEGADVWHIYFDPVTIRFIDTLWRFDGVSWALCFWDTRG